VRTPAQTYSLAGFIESFKDFMLLRVFISYSPKLKSRFTLLC